MAEMTLDMIEEAMMGCTIARNVPPEHMPEEAVCVIKELSNAEHWEGQLDVIVRCDYETSKRIVSALMAVSIEREVHIGAYEAEIYSCAPFIGYRYSEEDGALTLFVDDEFCKEFTPETVQCIDKYGKWDELLRRDAQEDKDDG